MANLLKKITDLPTGTLTADDVVVFVDLATGLTKKATLAELRSQMPVTTTTTDLTVGATDVIILGNTVSMPIVVTLPSAITVPGRQITVKDWKGTAGTKSILIATVLGQTIDGLASRTINTNYSAFSLVSDGANWVLI